ncbi:hypothetical protein ROA7450_03365 [Roseovarius albus]|uniref:Uncharacterized protein n=1 Tax=Roseovarius albus TaxID=1247867 RepID=A0A1X6ZZ29_9RHOB|nr:hypothetical protein [Roseovarius albus]SLN63966.1 hypothetical protein ROA7450_03365 [Roseovarius albus]
MKDYEETLVEFDGSGDEDFFEIPGHTEGLQYNAVCLNHNRSITGWTTSNSQIINAIHYHRQRNPGHSIRVYQRVV